MPRTSPVVLLAATVIFGILAASPALAQNGALSLEPTVELLGSGETRPYSRIEMGGRGAPADSIFYDSGDAVADGYLGFGSATPFYAALRFTPSSEFTLTGLRLAYRTESSGQPLYLWVFDASGGNDNPIGGTLLVEGNVVALSPTGRFGEFTINQPPPPFPAGSSFFIIAGFADVPYPMGTDDTGSGDYQGRSFFSGTGDVNDWTQLGDILGNGQPDVWVLRALGTSAGGGQQAQISVNPTSLSTSVASGNSATLNLTIGNAGDGPLNWSAAANGRSSEGRGETPSMVRHSDLQDDRDVLREALRAGRDARVIVRLDAAFVPEGDLVDRTIDEQRAGIAQARIDLEARMEAYAPTGVKRFQTVPYLAMIVDEAGLEALERDPAVISIHKDRWAPHHLAQSIPIIGAQNAWAQGLTGAGQAVAVLDSGFETGHPFLGGRTVAEACFSSTVPGLTQSLCPNGQQQQTGTGSAAACEITLDGCDHGTHVAGTALGEGASFSGVAPDANLIAVQVFTRVISPEICGSPQNTPCVLTSTSDQVLALEHVYSLRNTFSIASINMSLGGGQFPAACDDEPHKAIIDNLRAAGIGTVVAAGNEGYINAIGSPACISSAISVGSTQNGAQGTVVDAVSPFSNSSPVLDVLAPGQVITSSVLNGAYGPMSGTSMAAPHVAGAFAVLRQQRPEATVGELLETLSNTGIPITDPRNGITRPRIQLDAAVGDGGVTNWLSVTPSSGSTSGGGSSTLSVEINANGLAAGTHTGEIVITSNAANQSNLVVPVTVTVTGGSSTEPSPEAVFALAQNHPNPVGHATVIEYVLPEPASVRLEVFDTLGRRVAVLAEGAQTAGNHEVMWNPGSLAGGVYFYRLTAGHHATTRRMLVTR